MQPNFTGVWTLVHAKSDFGFLPPPRSRVDTIEHQGPQLRIRTNQTDSNGKLTVDRDLTIGAEPVAVLILNRTRWVRASWDGDALVVETTSEVSGAERSIEDRWTLDEAGSCSPSSACTSNPGEPSGNGSGCNGRSPSGSRIRNTGSAPGTPANGPDR